MDGKCEFRGGALAVDSMNPSADVLALSTTEVNLAPIAPGQRITVSWRGRPVFISHRTAKQIETARAIDKARACDPESDEARTVKPEWLIVIGVCTFGLCSTLGQGQNDPRGPYGGWYCPCHGSIYDGSGHVRRGPARKISWSQRNTVSPAHSWRIGSA
ncbi:MAG: ubiquinol-cytochrome c reductase iron-sulfur subunit [Hyphomicrobiaceae bacterium]